MVVELNPYLQFYLKACQHLEIILSGKYKFEKTTRLLFLQMNKIIVPFNMLVKFIGEKLLVWGGVKRGWVEARLNTHSMSYVPVVLPVKMWYSGDLKSNHLKSGNIQNPDFLKVIFKMVPIYLVLIILFTNKNYFY